MLELGEAPLLADTDDTLGALARLKQLGVRLAVDDFGTGYSSLSMLHRLPIDVVKIDRSFVAELGSDSRRAAVTRAAFGMAQALGLVVVAEGVETDRQLADLADIGVPYAQGHRFAQPLLEGDMSALLASGRHWRIPQRRG